MEISNLFLRSFWRISQLPPHSENVLLLPTGNEWRYDVDKCKKEGLRKEGVDYCRRRNVILFFLLGAIAEPLFLMLLGIGGWEMMMTRCCIPPLASAIYRVFAVYHKGRRR